MKKLPWSCKCGLKTNKLNRNSDDKCKRCYTFSADHLYVGHSGMDCAICMTHPQSHR